MLRSDNHYVQYVQAHCTSLAPSATTQGLVFGLKPLPKPGEDEILSPLGPFGTQPPDQACPDGEVAVGIRVRAGRFVDAIGLICGPVPVGPGAPTAKLPSPLVQAPSPALPLNPRAKNMRIPEDMFVIVKPGAGAKIPHGQLVITATEPKVGSTNVAELELRYLDAPANQQHSYPFTTIVSVNKAQLLAGYPVEERVTGGYIGRWQVRARSSMKAVPGPWSLPVQFQLVKAQPPPPMVQLPRLNAPITQAPVPNTGVAPTMVRPPTTSSQGGAASSLFVRPRGVEGQEAGRGPSEPAEPAKKP